jgi:putative phage-type endonuclease
MKIISLSQRTKEWLQWRRNKVMASDAPIITGHSKFKNIQELYEEKIKCYESVPNAWMQRGIDLEPIALEAFEKETGLIMFPCVGEHENGWMAASFDGMTIEGDAIVEIKAPGAKDHHYAEVNKMVPDKYMPQLQHQMHVAGLDKCFYYSFDGEKGIILEVKRDQDFIEKMIAKEFEFWQCLQTLTPPTITPKTRKKKNAAGAIP